MTDLTNKDVVNLLWTGGWDSTFRLLTLLLVKGKVVQPYYIIDADRRSTGLELKTIRDIKFHLFKCYPQINNLLLPTRFADANDIPADKRITDAHQRLVNQVSLGSQYDWLARFAKYQNIKNLELSIELSIVKKDSPPIKLLKSCLTPDDNGTDNILKIDEKYAGTDTFEVFNFFRFPLFKTSKLDMQTAAKAHGFYDLLLRSSFCHRPRPDGKPCGVCNPCRDAVQEGFGWRLPYTSRFRYTKQLLYTKIVDVFRNNFPKLYRTAKLSKNYILKRE